jgi:hypothetical protein
VDWHSENPSPPQAIVGTVFLLALAAVPLYLSLSEADVGNRIFLWVLGGLLLALATWRACIAVQLMRDQRPMQ